MEQNNKTLVFSPQPGATLDEVMEILNFLFFQTYSPELKTRENLMASYEKLSPTAKRHFKLSQQPLG